MRVGGLVELRDARFRDGRGQVAVALRHPDVGVTEQVADDEQRRSAHDEVARVRVAKRVSTEGRDARSARDPVQAIRQEPLSPKHTAPPVTRS